MLSYWRTDEEFEIHYAAKGIPFPPDRKIVHTQDAHGPLEEWLDQDRDQASIFRALLKERIYTEIQCARKYVSQIETGT